MYPAVVWTRVPCSSCISSPSHTPPRTSLPRAHQPAVILLQCQEQKIGLNAIYHDIELNKVGLGRALQGKFGIGPNKPSTALVYGTYHLEGASPWTGHPST